MQVYHKITVFSKYNAFTPDKSENWFQFYPLGIASTLQWKAATLTQIVINTPCTAPPRRTDASALIIAAAAAFCVTIQGHYHCHCPDYVTNTGGTLSAMHRRSHSSASFLITCLFLYLRHRSQKLGPVSPSEYIPEACSRCRLTG